MTTAEQPRKLHEIGAEIAHLFVVKKPSESTLAYSMPYVSAISQMEYVEDMYGQDTGRSVVLYLLGNLQGWRGDDARRIKAELKARLDDYNKGVRYRA